MILYITKSKIIKKQVPTFKYLKTQTEYSYISAEIELKLKHKTIAKFELKNNIIKKLPERKQMF